MVSNKLQVAALVSGGGTTVQAIINATKSGRLPRIDPVCVICSPGSEFPQNAKANGIDIEIFRIDPKPSSRLADQILDISRKKNIDLIGQYGWMEWTPQAVIEAYPNMMINQHPAPLDPGRPHFGGKGMWGYRAHCARLFFLRKANKSGSEMYTEACAQRVDVNYDEGVVLKKRIVPVRDDDDPITLKMRVLAEEHEVQIETLADFAENNVTEITRDEPLIDIEAGELEILNEAKVAAKFVFPKG